jgi:(p)ppGpp synthase/HD superfamily hydrolase
MTVRQKRPAPSAKERTEPLVTTARKFARARHRGSTGRDGSSPYFDHVASVAAHVAAAGGSPRLVAAAYLHDVVEDTGVTVDELSDRFGAEVAEIVDHTTNPSVDPGTGRPLSWLEQKRMAVAEVADGSRDVVWLKAADLCANASELVANHDRMGTAVWRGYGATPNRQLGYYLRLGDVLMTRLDNDYLRGEVRRNLADLHAVSRADRVRPLFPRV